ncbi:kinase-like domain-containing protein [Irpex rosettiformis]|uniref:Kinase-like domain-containing protein n=1 Tax=Irpex rosettiformis TaxID=378272 RepID=A0ACB8U347_9APHY|nr:kinase-like domain-containing protein [Irpex rosettiformis]
MYRGMPDDITDSPFFSIAPLEPEWQQILHSENQVVLYNPTSHALSIQQHEATPRTAPVVRRNPQLGSQCPYCHRPMQRSGTLDEEGETVLDDIEAEDDFQTPRSRAPDYFQLLQVANETGSVPSTPTTSQRSTTPTLLGSNGNGGESPFRPRNMAEGYFETFFQEECRLGMGANGSVYLCQHVLDGNPLGRFAVKKIAVGQSHSYLLTILREVRLLEKLHHPNIVTYHHSWLETCQFSSFGPKVPTLHVLMQWAEGGSLDDFIDARMGRTFASLPAGSNEHSSPQPNPSAYSRAARIRAFRAMQHASPEERERLRREMSGLGMGGGRSNVEWKPVHLLSADEVKSLFKDVVEGLAFLHDKSILHLDLKPGNVLLTWDEGRLLTPRAMLSDFGTSQDMLNSRTRSGNTGTLEYAAPESLPSPTTGLLSQVDSKSDMWSLGMILHRMLFFRLPYQHASDSVDKSKDSRGDERETAELLEREVSTYPGFKSTPSLLTAFESRHLPRAFLVLLENLLHVRPSARPTCEKVLVAIRDGAFDPLTPSGASNSDAKNSLVPARRSSDDNIPRGAAQPTMSSNIQEVELPQWVDEPSRDALVTVENEGGIDEGSPFLRLPSPPLPSEQVPAVRLRMWNRDVLVIKAPSIRAMMIRTIKSSLLVAKVWWIFSLSRNPGANHNLLVLALGFAVIDTWYDGLMPTLFLGIAHLGIMSAAFPRGYL